MDYDCEQRCTSESEGIFSVRIFSTILSSYVLYNIQQYRLVRLCLICSFIIDSNMCYVYLPIQYQYTHTYALYAARSVCTHFPKIQSIRMRRRAFLRKIGKYKRKKSRNTKKRKKKKTNERKEWKNIIMCIVYLPHAEHPIQLLWLTQLQFVYFEHIVFVCAVCGASFSSVATNVQPFFHSRGGNFVSYMR